MADIISNILIGVNPKVKSGSWGVGDNTATYECTVGENVLSPVTGTIEEINTSSNEVIIKSRGGKYTINGCNVSGVGKGDPVSLGSPIGKTTSKKITLKSKQDLSSLESKDEKKENNVNNTENSGELGFNSSDTQKIWDKTVGKMIGISNIPYDVASKRIKRAIKKVTRKESIDIKNNVLSEELKRIKSLF